jgi:hypothetical protein
MYTGGISRERKLSRVIDIILITVKKKIMDKTRKTAKESRYFLEKNIRKQNRIIFMKNRNKASLVQSFEILLRNILVAATISYIRVP